jgi:hypothetical protein
MEEKLVHYYNVIEGKCMCGAPADLKEKSFSVFPQNVNCPACLALIKRASGKSDGKSG